MNYRIIATSNHKGRELKLTALFRNSLQKFKANHKAKLKQKALDSYHGYLEAKKDLSNEKKSILRREGRNEQLNYYMKMARISKYRAQKAINEYQLLYDNLGIKLD